MFLVVLFSCFKWLCYDWSSKADHRFVHSSNALTSITPPVLHRNNDHSMIVPLQLLVVLATTTYNAMASASPPENGKSTVLKDNDNSAEQCVVDVDLSAVTETALWTLQNRAIVALDSSKEWFQDDKAVEIYSSINYDYKASFGKPDEGSGIRSWLFDQHILDFWRTHPEGTVVNFAEGLETQRFRLEESRPLGTLWITVDLPPAIKAREHFILPSDENLHVATSVLETGEWMHLVPRDKPVFFTAQGLFMYLNEKDLRGLLQEIAIEFPSSTILFDSISKRLSDKAMSPNGWKLTDTYKTPPMPFGANKDKAQGVFQSWVPNAKVEEVPWPLKKASGFFMQYVAPYLIRLPMIQNLVPGMVMKMEFPPSTK